MRIPLLVLGVWMHGMMAAYRVGPTTLETPHGPTTVTRVGLWVDEPRTVAEVIRRRRSAPLR